MKRPATFSTDFGVEGPFERPSMLQRRVARAIAIGAIAVCVVLLATVYVFHRIHLSTPFT